jgi:pSer/pThr/pTyr-binding forkhead associated (FHA) protein
LVVVDLVILSGSRAGAVFSIPEVPIVVGRSPEANVHVDDPWISNMHALFERRGREIWVVDLGSRNGTFVDDRRVAEARLKLGMSVAFGRTRLELRRRTAAPPPDSRHLKTPVRRHPVGITVPHQTRLRPAPPPVDEPERAPLPPPSRPASGRLRPTTGATRLAEGRGSRRGSKG